AAVLAVEFLVRIDAEVLAFDVVAGQLAQSKEVGVVLYLLESEPASQRFEVCIVRVSERLSERHARAPSDLDRRVTRNHSFAQGRESYCQLDGGAWLCAL